MANLQDIINLSKTDGGKFFVMDEQGEVKLVILGVEEYNKILVSKPRPLAVDAEKVNREIINAQLEDVAVIPPVLPAIPEVRVETKPPRVDLREEVIDPSFDFEGPKMEIDDL